MKAFGRSLWLMSKGFCFTRWVDNWLVKQTHPVATYYQYAAYMDRKQIHWTTKLLKLISDIKTCDIIMEIYETKLNEIAKQDS